MPQGISPNPLNKISEVYLSQISEHHKKDADGNTIPHEDELDEAKVDQGRSDYGKASIRNYRRMGPGHGEPGMFDPEGKRGKTIDKRREEHKARRGVKGAKGPAYKVEEVEVDEAMAMKPSNMKKKAKLGAALDRLQALKVAKKKKEMGEEIENEGMQYGIFKGDGKPKGAMAAFGKKDKAKKDKKIKMEALSNWKEDYVWEQDEEEMQKEVKEKKVKNKIIINPKLGEAVEELGGQLLDVQEMNGDKKEDPQMKSKMLRQRQLKKQVLLRKLQAVRQTGGEDIVAHYEPEGEQVDEALGTALAIGGALGIAGGMAALTPKIKKFANQLKQKTMQRTGLKNLKQEYELEGEQLDEYGNPRVGVRLRVARAIDKVNPKPKMGSKRTAISNKLKMSAIKAETKRREQKENPYSAGKKVRMALGMSNEDYIPEEGYDIARDMGKIPPTKDKKDATTMPRKPEPMKGMTAAQKAAKGKSALDIVKADIRKKYGKGAIMGEAKDELDENQFLTNLRNKFINMTRNNKNFKIPLGKNKFLPSAAGREAQILKGAGLKSFDDI